MGSDWDIESRPDEQMDALVAIYASGAVLTFGHDLRPLSHAREGVWELKTPDLRIFGWFYKMDCFVADKAGGASKIKDHDLYYGYINEVVRFRNALDLTPPKYVPGEDPRVVISNFSYS